MANSYLIKIYGSSDDLLEIEGEIEDEVCKIDGPFNIGLSDGTLAKFTYDGEWKCEIKKQGRQFASVVKSVGEDARHTGEAESCTPYSDVLLVREPISWVRVDKKYFRKHK